MQSTEQLDIDSIVQNIFSPQIQTFEPFASSVDPSRSNMSSKQILQIITSRMNDSPYILNKAYRDFSEVKSNYLLRATHDGVIIDNKFNMLFFYYKEFDQNGNPTTRVVFEYTPPVKKLLSIGLPLRYTRPIGAFKKGDILFDYTGQNEDGIPKLGYRAKIMFASFLGYNAEDAVVISESFSKRAQIDYTEKMYIPITKKHKYIKNKNGKYFGEVGDRQIGRSFSKYIRLDGDTSLDSSILNISDDDTGYYINDIAGLEDGEIVEVKVHKVTNRQFKELAPEYKYSPDLILEISLMFKKQYDEYMEMKKAYSGLKAQIPNINLFVDSVFMSYKSNSKLPAKLLNEIAESYKLIDKDIDYILEIDILQTVPTVLGDKFANCYAGKGVDSIIIPDHLMPRGVDVIFNPLGIYGRNNWGMIFEVGLASIIENVESTVNDKEITKNKIQFINDNFINIFDKEYYDKVNELLTNFDALYESFRENVNLHGFYLFVDNFPGISYHEYFEKFIKLFSEKYGTVIEAETYKFSKELWDFIIKERGYTSVCIDPNDLYDIETNAFFGSMYYLKLQHTAESKYNATAQARSYNRANGQPAKGRKAEGGVHWGWQSVNADQGHNDNSSISKELHTFKSACVEEKINFIKNYTFNGEYNLKDKDIVSPTVLNVSHLLSLFGLRFANETQTIEISKETEALRVKIEEEKRERLSSYNIKDKNDDIFDYDIDKFDNDFDTEEDRKRLIDEEERLDYIQEIIGH